jgi:uncharacterized NAD(P)/FAD-binding protein YdhS
MGEYLEWSYHTLVSELPDHVRVVHHRTTATDVARTTSGRETVTLADATVLEVDDVVLATGHTPNANRGGAFTQAIPPYPVESYMHELPAGETVAVRGMGLVALDVMVALTIGRGGSFHESPRNSARLQYRPSGREPIIYLFSRTGFPYCAKSSHGRSSGKPYTPAIMTPQAIDELRHEHGPRNWQLDARRDVLPLLFAEMQLRYYSRAALLRHNDATSARVYNGLAAAWRVGAFRTEVETLAERYGEFDAEQHFFVGRGAEYITEKDFEQQVYDIVDADLDEALRDSVGRSPVKTAYGIPRQLRDTLRRAVDEGGLTPESQVDFQRNIRPRITRLIAGPPVIRTQQLLALMDADIVRLVAGPSPVIEQDERGGVVLRSQQLREPVTVRADHFVCGTLDDPSVAASASPLLANLYGRGRIRPLSADESEAGSVALTAELNPLNDRGQAEHSLWVLGTLTEGARYYTGYIPSPRDQRASLDAAACVAAMTRRQP